MRITSSDITLAAQSQQVRFEQHTIAVRTSRETPADPPAAARRAQEAERAANRAAADHDAKLVEARRQLWASDPMLARYIDLLERMFGVQVQILDPDDLAANGASEVLVAQAEQLGTSTRPSLAITVDISRTRYEADDVTFEAAGRVTTSDGRTIDLALQSQISREYLEHSSTQVRIGAPPPKDPLVLNLAGLPATLEEAQIEFDLNADGRLDRFHVLGGGSAYLTWDRNGDGVVNDGTELFGPASGNGYGELAAHDLDGNGWIDEGDRVWAELALWRPATGGPQTTTSLSAAEIGAIYLGHVATPFTLTPGSSDEARGDVRATGLFLREDGTPGTVQQLDLRA